MHINENFLKYKIYEAAIETGNDDIYYQMLDEGLFDGFMGKLKGLFGSKEEQQEVDKAMEDIEKPLAKIVGSLKTAGKKPDEIKAFISTVIDKVLKAAPAGGASGGQGAPSGTPVTSDSDESRSAMASAAAAAAGQNPKQATEKAADMKPDAVYDLLIKGFAKKTGIEIGKVKSILDYITKNNLLQTEGRLVTLFDLRKVVNELHKSERDVILMERWQVLAGMQHDVIEEGKLGDLFKIVQAGASKAAQIAKSLPSVTEFIEKAIAKIPPEHQAAFKKLLADNGIDPTKPETFKTIGSEKLQKLFDFIKAKVKPDGGADAAGDKSGAKGAEPVPDEVQKKFSDLAEKIVGKIKGVKKVEILKVIAALNDSDSLEVKPS